MGNAKQVPESTGRLVQTWRGAAQGMRTMDLGLGEPQMAIRSHTREHWIKPHRKAFIKVQQNSVACVH